MGVVGTYPIGDSATHTSDHSNATPIAKTNHLLSHRLRSHEHASNINLEHGVAVLGRVLQRRRLLLDTGRSDEAVHAALGVGDVLDDAVEQFCVTHVDAAVVQFCAEILGALLDLGEFGGLVLLDGMFERGVGGWCRTGSSRRSRAYTFAPASSRASVWVRPRPRPAPETQTTLPARLNSGIRDFWPMRTGWVAAGAVGTSVVSMATDIMLYRVVV